MDILFSFVAALLLVCFFLSMFLLDSPRDILEKYAFIGLRLFLGVSFLTLVYILWNY